MKVLLINGSPHANGNTSIALTEVAKTLETEGIETVTIGIGVQPVRGCVACGACKEVCPVECIAEGDIYVIDASQCIDCGACEAGCPAEAIVEE
jgi:multimeric flavodoxin WrbA